MEILTGIFVLFCAGVVTGYSLLYVSIPEAPKKEPAPQAMMQQSQDPGKAAEPLLRPPKKAKRIHPRNRNRRLPANKRADPFPAESPLRIRLLRSLSQ